VAASSADQHYVADTSDEAVPASPYHHHRRCRRPGTHDACHYSEDQSLHIAHVLPEGYLDDAGSPAGTAGVLACLAGETVCGMEPEATGSSRPPSRSRSQSPRWIRTVGRRLDRGRKLGVVSTRVLSENG
jgi:hypothetical protein